MNRKTEEQAKLTLRMRRRDLEVLQYASNLLGRKQNTWLYTCLMSGLEQELKKLMQTGSSQEQKRAEDILGRLFDLVEKR